MKLDEMALPVGDMSANADAYASAWEPHLKDSPHVGDIDIVDGLTVRNDGLHFSLWKGDEMVCLLKVEKKDDYVKVDSAWTKASYRGKGVLSKLLWFLKSRENYTKILLSAVHSADTQQIINGGGYSRFVNKYWFNPETGEREDFDPSNVKKFYDASPWSLMLEHNGNSLLKNLPRFNTLEAGFITQCYDWQIE